MSKPHGATVLDVGVRHSDIKATELYDRRDDEVSFSEIEHVGIRSSSNKKQDYSPVFTFGEGDPFWRRRPLKVNDNLIGDICLFIMAGA
jgi:hypothetical protein